jgi:hypothetical protein
MDQQNVGSKRTASPTTGKIAAKSHETADQLKDAVVDQVNQARDRAVSAKEHTTERIRGVAGQLRNMSDTLRDQDPFVADVAQRASRGVDGLASYVSNATPQGIIRDTEQLARRQPVMFYGAAFLVGLAAARFIKSSRPEGSQTRGDYEPREGSFGQRRERESGFFPSAERNMRSNQRFQENYDAAFHRDGLASPNDAAGGASTPLQSGATPGTPRATMTESGAGMSEGGNIPRPRKGAVT